MYDLIIKNGIIIDGTGSPSFHADVAIKDGKIARIARNLTGSQQEIDATGPLDFLLEHGLRPYPYASFTVHRLIYDNILERF